MSIGVEAKSTTQTLVLQTPTLEINCDLTTQQLTLLDRIHSSRLLFTESLAVFTPQIDGQSIEWTFRDGELRCDTEIVLRFSSATIDALTVHIAVDQTYDAVDIHCECTADAAMQVNALQLFPMGSTLNMYDMVNFRNRQYTAATYPELNLGCADGCQTDTYSGDWQFAPHPSCFVFRKAAAQLFFGAYDLPRAFGMYLTVKNYRVEKWSLDYGSHPYGQCLAAGERFVSPRFRLFLRHGVGLEEIFSEFSRMLIQRGQIPDPAEKERYAWWQAPLYCTWIDQMYAASMAHPDTAPTAISGQTAPPATAMLTEELVRQAVEVIKREQLPFRTILLDEGWHVTRGEWEPHPARFPHFRQLIDDLHADGFKVVVWWSWSEVDDDAVVDPAHLIAGGKRNRHGRRMRDYSRRATQEDYLKPLCRRLFSSAPDCFDLDGFKSDFLADKVHADMPVDDPAWRGEENYLLHLARFVYQEMKRYKTDAVHIGCAGHFWLAPCIDINRTYDVYSSNYLEHERRADMLRMTTPGCPVAYDFHMVREHLTEYFASARRRHAAVQIGNILYVKDDSFSPIRPANAQDYALLRNGLSASK